MRVSLILLVLASSLATPLSARDISLPDGPYISTSADAEVERPPDFAVVKLSGRHVEATPDAARARIDKLLERVLDVLAEFDAAVDSQRLEAMSFGEHRTYGREQEGRVPAGYYGSFGLEVRVADFDQLNALQYRLAEFEFSSMRGPTFGLTETHRAELEEQARVASIREATRRAGELAAAQGATLGPIWGVLHEPMHRIAGADPGLPLGSTVVMHQSARADPSSETFDMGLEPRPIRVRARAGVVYELIPCPRSDRT